MDEAENQEVCDDMVFDIITRNAKPAITLERLQELLAPDMEASEYKPALGRLWRACRIFRSKVENASQRVQYWTGITHNAAQASGLIPEISDGSIHMVVAQHAKHRKEVQNNAVVSLGQLIPDSRTARLPAFPEAKGVFGNLHRNSTTSKVAMVVFKYRDSRLSIDALMYLSGVNREDAGRVVSQLGKKSKGYFLKHGYGRDTKFQWNPKFCYPFPAHTLERNTDLLPATALTEDETEIEIAKLIHKATVEDPSVLNVEVKRPHGSKAVKLDNPKTQTLPVLPEFVTVTNFDATLSLSGVLTLVLDGTPIKFTAPQTVALLALIAPAEQLTKVTNG